MMDQTKTRRAHSQGGIPTFAFILILAVALGASPTLGSAQESGQKTFSTARAACEALVSAVKSHDETALIGILGKDAKEIVSSGDPAEDKQHQEDFVQKYQQMHRLVL